MTKTTDARPVGATLYFINVDFRMPLKFGPETVTKSTKGRARVTIENRDGKRFDGWGETPLSVTWVWPSSLSFEERLEAMQRLCVLVAEDLASFDRSGHALEIGHAFTEERLPALLDRVNAERPGAEAMPWLGALVCFSLFDIALHDAYGKSVGRDVYETYNAEYMNADLSAYLEPADDARGVSFDGKYPQDYLKPRQDRLPVWHLVGGTDPLDDAEKARSASKDLDDGYPVTLEEWIATDGLTCLKVKLRGADQAWDYDRLVKVGEIGVPRGVWWLTADFNCTVKAPDYVNEILDRLKDEHPRLYQMILYVEQPFPYDLEANPIDVRSIASRKPIFMDESAHDWKVVRLGRTLGWSGVALKTCKTQSGALLSLAWARAHGMTLMVQDLSNPMLAQIPHVLLASHAGTIMGVESNGMQFTPDASKPEAAVHPGCYKRREGVLDLSTIQGPGFGYRIEEMKRELPEPAVEFST